MLKLIARASLAALLFSSPAFAAGGSNGGAPAATASNQQTVAIALGSPTDAAYNGTNTITIYSLLKAMYGQAVQTAPPGTPPTVMIGIQGNASMVPLLIAANSAIPTLGTAPVNTYKLASSAASTNATNFATGAKRISGIRVCSAVATPRFVKVFDKGTSAPVPGTDTPKFTIPLPSAGCAFTDAYSLVNGLGIAITAGASDTDTTAVSAGDVYSLNIDTN